MQTTSSAHAVRGSHSKSQTYFHGLDLIRGLAALAVLVYHIDFAFGLRGKLLTGAYTAVDLFFILSGFVITSTYENAIRSDVITFVVFMRRRLARLYPLFIATTFVGFFVMTARWRVNTGFIEPFSVVAAALSNLFMLPAPLAVNGSFVLFPFNAASWSIFFELLINIIFFFCFARASSTTLFLLWILSGLLLAASVACYGNVDLGWSWVNFVAAMPRVSLSFLSGMLISRQYTKQKWTSGGLMLYIFLALHLCYIQIRYLIPKEVAGLSDIVVVVLLLPLTVAAGAGVDMRGRMSHLSTFLGDASYAVYLTQDALIIIVAGFCGYILKTKIYDLAPISGFILFALCITTSHVCFRYLEMPARECLRAPSHCAFIKPIISVLRSTVSIWRRLVH